MTAESYRTSFYKLTSGQSAETPDIKRIEIPLFQRDYAQGRGRDSDPVGRIRTSFLDRLFEAVGAENSVSVGLDFVYGVVDDDGTLQPLDGQQRLTTLFLLHWYLAWRLELLGKEHGLRNFSYATRESARMFCESLVGEPKPGEGPQKDEKLSSWIKDRPWYLFIWRNDPTIQSMLVVLDGIHERFDAVNHQKAWDRLIHDDEPAIWFLFLPLRGPETDKDTRPEKLYIKMNSRGKPLTEFENLKAHFEKTIQWSDRCNEFAKKIDGEWSDLLWRLRGGRDDDLIDDMFLRYLEFVTQICEWRWPKDRTNGTEQRLDLRMQAVFGENCQERKEREERKERKKRLNFLIEAFDAGSKMEPINEWLGSHRDGKTGTGTDKVPLTFRSPSADEKSVDLFKACCRQDSSLGRRLLLYAVLLHLIEDTDTGKRTDTDEFKRRIRVLRNLIEASGEELKSESMPKILNDVHAILNGALEKVATLNQAQVEDEKLKREFLKKNPDLRQEVFALEDLWILRGSLGAFDFDLDPQVFKQRAVAFEELMLNSDLRSTLLTALLATGEYHRQLPRKGAFLFGTDDDTHHEDAWRKLLTGASRDELKQTRQVLGEFLDRVAVAEAGMGEITSAYLLECESNKRFDWRYYMVKYPSMREDGSSRFFSEDKKHMGYSLCMVQAGKFRRSSLQRDPYLLSIAHKLKGKYVDEVPEFIGYAHQERWLSLSASKTKIRCVTKGFELKPPEEVSPNDEFWRQFKIIRCGTKGLELKPPEVVSPDDEFWTQFTIDCQTKEGCVLVELPQVEVDDRPVDTIDRIEVGAKIVEKLEAPFWPEGGDSA